MKKTDLSEGNVALRNKDYEGALHFYTKALSTLPELAELLQSNIELAKNKIIKETPSNTKKNNQKLVLTKPRAAIVVHVFYPELWSTIADRLDNVSYPYDLYITTSPERANEIEKAIRPKFPQADIRIFPNIGMDILPFLRLISELHNRGYSAICKIHTKRGDGDLADVWRNIMLDGNISNNQVIEETVQALHEKRICLAGPSILYQSADRLMYKNRLALSKIANDLYPGKTPISDWGFFAGSMFWCSPESYLSFSEQALKSVNQRTELYERDGKLEHAWERAFGLIPAYEKNNIGLIMKHSINASENVLVTCAADAWIGKANIDDAMRQFKILKEESCFVKDLDAIDTTEYRLQLPFGDAEYDPYVHYLTEGTFSDLRPAPFFSPQEYREKNQDVVRAHREPYVHFLKSGHIESRKIHSKPKIDEHKKLVASLWRRNREKNNWKGAENRKKLRNLVSIIIPCFGNSELTISCLKSIKKAKNKTIFELLIIDNGSSKEELNNLKLQLPEIELQALRIIENSENYNFAVGCNIGAVNSSGNTLVFLNNDTVVTDNWLDELIKPLEEKEIGAVQPKLIYPDGTIQCIGIVFSEKSPLGYPIYCGEPNEGAHVNTARSYQAITAACIAVRADDFYKLRGFDPIFVNGQEDIDFCFRLKRETNLDSFYTPNSVVYHHESKTPTRGKYIRENRIAFIERWAKSVVSDDLKYYLADERTSNGWVRESPENQRLGIGISRPDASGNKPRDKQKGWDDLLEITCLARISATYKRFKSHVDNTLVSICMPAYNREGPIANAVRSISSQTHRNFELIICDDGSNDGTLNAIRQLETCDTRIKIIEAPHEGVSAARNRCLEAANGDFIFFLDSDNTWTSDFLRNMITFMSVGNVESAYCGLKILNNDGVVTKILGRDFDWLDCIEDNFVDMNVFGHRRISNDSPRFDTTLKRLVDWDYILEVTSNRSCSFIPFLGVNYYNGTDHERITTTVSQGAAVRENQQQVRNKHLMKPVMQVNKQSFRQHWSFYLTTENSKFTVNEWFRLRQKNLLVKRATELEGLLKNFSSGRNSLNIRIKIPAPNLMAAPNWGDYHFGLALADALRKRGHLCEVDCIDQWGNNKNADVVIVLRGLSTYVPQPEHLNLVWFISHPDKVSDSELENFDHVLVASDLYANKLSQRLMTSISVMHQAVDPNIFKPSYAKLPKSSKIIFIGNSRNVYREIVKDALSLGTDIEVWGKNWSQFINSKHIMGDYIPNKDLGKFYANSGILLNDHWEDMKKYGFISNRLFDAVACGAKIISDEVPGISDLFEGAVITYANKEDLKKKIDILLNNDPLSAQERASIAKRVALNNSFEKRAEDLEKIIKKLFENISTSKVIFNY